MKQIIMEEIQKVFKDLPFKKTLGLDRFENKLYQTFKTEIYSHFKAKHRKRSKAFSDLYMDFKIQ